MEYEITTLANDGNSTIMVLGWWHWVILAGMFWAGICSVLYAIRKSRQAADENAHHIDATLHSIWESSRNAKKGIR